MEWTVVNLNRLLQEGGESRSIWCEGLERKELNGVAKCFPKASILITRLLLLMEPHLVLTVQERSSVFNSMFSHDQDGKNMSSINIEDMSVEALRVFLTYMYSNIKYEDFMIHRLYLLGVAEKYDVLDLKDACEESLLEVIDTKNVLKRLQIAFVYRLSRLKVGCIRYLMKFGKLFEIRGEFVEFIQSQDRELANEVNLEVISVVENS